MPSKLTILLNVRILVHPDNIYDKVRILLRYQLVMILTNDCEQWWIGKRKETERSVAVGNGYDLCQFIGSTGLRKPGLLRWSRNRPASWITLRRVGWNVGGEQFREQFSWLTVNLPLTLANETIRADTGPPSKMEVIQKVFFWKGIGLLDRMSCRPSYSRKLAVLTSGNNALVINLGKIPGP